MEKQQQPKYNKILFSDLDDRAVENKMWSRLILCVELSIQFNSVEFLVQLIRRAVNPADKILLFFRYVCFSLKCVNLFALITTAHTRTHMRWMTYESAERVNIHIVRKYTHARAYTKKVRERDKCSHYVSFVLSLSLSLCVCFILAVFSHSFQLSPFDSLNSICQKTRTRASAQLFFQRINCHTAHIVCRLFSFHFFSAVYFIPRFITEIFKY